MAFRMRLGAYGFEWNPDTVTVPETKKTVAVQDTYNGSALFQWPPITEGMQVDLKWEWMSIGQYNSLRAKYLVTEEIVWWPSASSKFMVVPVVLDSSYFETSLDDAPYRKDVTMRLSIRTTYTGAVTTTT